jgi:MFS family permease
VTSAVRNYALVTGAYWAFTLSDGALRMLVLLHFHRLGFTPLQLSFLFLLYELFGVVTNLLGGWIASRVGLKVTLTAGLFVQVAALVLLSAVDPDWVVALSVAWVMAAQALSGVAKDLTKMSAKSSLKVLVPEGAASSLFRWVALLTGSKNALKGVGFFVGGLLLATVGFRPALWGMAAVLALVLVLCIQLPGELGRARVKAPFGGLLSRSRDINVISGARFFLFGARDVWFVVGVPVFLASALGWGFTEVGTFMALWVIGYGGVQTLAPLLVTTFTRGQLPGGRTALWLALLLAAVMGLLLAGLHGGAPTAWVLLGGLGLFGVVFAVNSSVHSYLILAYSDGDKVAVNVGFYYMANAGGRLVGTLLSGLVFQLWGLTGCLVASLAFALGAAGVSALLPPERSNLPLKGAYR